MNNPLDEFGAKVRAEREARGLTQKQLAEKLGMSHRTVMQAEICRSNPKMENGHSSGKGTEHQFGCTRVPRNGNAECSAKVCL